MAERPVFMYKETVPFYQQINVNFEWNGGFAVSQKQKNIKAIHAEFERKKPEKKCLEISSKSYQDGGEALSAFFLKKYVPSLGKSIPVECVFQAGKVFKNGGPYKDLMEVTPREAKRDERLKNSGKLIGFTFEGIDFPLEPKTIFYDYIYINALFENPDLAKVALEYDAFTDIEFNPNKSLNCQAKAAATFVALTRLGLIDKVKEFSSFVELYSFKPEVVKEVEPEAKPEVVQIQVGSQIKHKAYGIGTVKSINGTSLKVDFPEDEERTLSLPWCQKNCELIQ